MNTTTKYDAIVVGAGHNGMACAFYLARARRRVLVIEAADAVGGAARPVPFGGGTVPLAAGLDYGLSRRVVDDLELERHGLKFADSDVGATVIGNDDTRIDYHLSRDDAASLAKHDAADAAAWPAFRARLVRYAAILADIRHHVPPRLSGSGADARAWLAIAWKLRRLGREDMREFLRIGAMNVFDLLEEEFRHPLFKGALAAEAVIGHPLAPRSPGSVLTLLLRFADGGGAAAMPAGGMSAVAAAMQAACASRGVAFRLDTRVVRIVVDDDRAIGVELDGGEVIEAPTVVSNVDARTTCLDLVGAGHFDTDLVRRLTHVRSRGVSARIDYWLDGGAPGGGADLSRRLIHAGDSDAIERAFNHSKYGEVSAEPLVELVFPGRIDPGLRTGRGEAASALVQYAPRAADDAGSRTAVAAATRTVVERMVPGLGARIAAERVVLPADVERLTGASGGHWHHGDIALDQYFMLRPVPALARYALPVAGCWLCGAGSHPGGGISGLPGRNAALAILSAAETGH